MANGRAPPPRLEVFLRVGLGAGTVTARAAALKALRVCGSGLDGERAGDAAGEALAFLDKGVALAAHGVRRLNSSPMNGETGGLDGLRCASVIGPGHLRLYLRRAPCPAAGGSPCQRKTLFAAPPVDPGGR